LPPRRGAPSTGNAASIISRVMPGGWAKHTPARAISAPDARAMNTLCMSHLLELSNHCNTANGDYRSTVWWAFAAAVTEWRTPTVSDHRDGLPALRTIRTYRYFVRVIETIHGS
jgi:hypothetical protein